MSRTTMPTVRSYAEAETFLSKGKDPNRRKIGNNTYVIRNRFSDMAPGDIAVRLHGTDVVTFHSDGTFTLRHGGWRTVTTADRIREFSPVRDPFVSFRGDWCVVHRLRDKIDCDFCHGEGHYSWNTDPCFRCNGTGQVRKPKYLVWNNGAVTIRKDGTVVQSRTMTDYFSPKLVEQRKQAKREADRARRAWRKEEKARAEARRRAILMDPRTHANHLLRAVDRWNRTQMEYIAESRAAERMAEIKASIEENGFDSSNIWFKGVTQEYRSPVWSTGELTYTPGTDVWADGFDSSSSYCSKGIHIVRTIRAAQGWAGGGRVVAVAPFGEIVNPEAEKSRVAGVRVLMDVTP